MCVACVLLGILVCAVWSFLLYLALWLLGICCALQPKLHSQYWCTRLGAICALCEDAVFVCQFCNGNALAFLVCLGRWQGWHCSSLWQCRGLSAILCFGVSQHTQWKVLLAILGFCAPIFPPNTTACRAADDDIDMASVASRMQSGAASSSADEAIFSSKSSLWWPEHGAMRRSSQTIGKFIGAAKNINVSKTAGTDPPEGVLRLHGARSRKIDTDGDGACAIHSIFGFPSPILSNRL